MTNCLTIAKFSVFESNWVSAGGQQFSQGGAIAIFYEYITTPTTKVQSIQITDSIFLYNVAFGVVSIDDLPDLQAGEGGAVSVLGISTVPLLMENISFVGNIADSNLHQPIYSLGGALTVSQTQMECTYCTFQYNVAIGGFGNDIATPTDTNYVDDIYFYSADFIPVNNYTLSIVLARKVALEEVVRELITNSVESFVDVATDDHRPISPDDIIDQFRIYESIIGVIVTSAKIHFVGNTTIERSNFGNFHMAIGNVLSLIKPELSYLDLSNASLTISGAFTPNIAMISTVNAKIYINSYTCFERLNSLNGSLFFSGDVKISGTSIMTGSTFQASTSVLGMPRVEFNGRVFHGVDDIDFFGIKDLRWRLEKFYHNSKLTFSHLEVVLNGLMEITNVTSAMGMVLRNGSSFLITESGSLNIHTPFLIEGTGRSSIFQNKGVVTLLSKEDSFTTLRVAGCKYQQFSDGVLNISLNENFMSESVVYLDSNDTLLGTINTTIVEGTKLALYPPDGPTTFDIISYKKIEPSTSGNKSLEYNTDDGIYFQDEDHTYGEDDDSDNITDNYRYITEVVVSNIDCNSLSTYYYVDESVYTTESAQSNYLCHICLMNTSCAFCSSGCYADRSSCDGAEVFSPTCCPENCNGNGNCQSNNNYASFECVCEFWYSGSSCSVLSLASYLLIAFGVFIFLFGLLSFRYYIHYKAQPFHFVEDLLHQLSADKESGVVNADTLQRLQQEFILKDVFVQYNEIKIEDQIGEGSFGVVYKATFRGAQVALKKLRTPMFMQLTANDIVEFRKEAYMMSRLRHPNIVLVMGISVVGLEPPARISIDDVENEIESPHASNSAVPTKTLCILTEFLEQGSLADILYGSKRVSSDVWSYELVLICAIQAGKGMLYLHSQSPPICHRDLKSSNLVVDNHWVVKVTDFGMSRIVPGNSMEGGKEQKNKDHKTLSRQSSKIPEFETKSAVEPADLEMTANLGTTAWCAPEIFTAPSQAKARYSLPVDVYSFGMVLWELWERKRPYEELPSRFDMIDAIKAGNRPAISESCPTGLRSLIQRCWNVGT